MTDFRLPVTIIDETDARMPTTNTNLYRRGNAAIPRLSHVRVGKDIDVHPINGIDWVDAHSGGVSTFSMRPTGANWWLLPAGYDYPDELAVVNDHGDHYSWEPNVDMSLADYIALLTIVDETFDKVS